MCQGHVDCVGKVLDIKKIANNHKLKYSLFDRFMIAFEQDIKKNNFLMIFDNKTKILVTGGKGRFAKILREKNRKLRLFFTDKKRCNILNLKFDWQAQFHKLLHLH